MRKVFLFIAAALLANLSIVSAASFTGFDANNRLGYLIDDEDLIQNKVNVAVNQTTGSYNHTISLIDVGEGTFTMGGVTFSYTHKSEPGKIAYKVYDNYIQPNGADRIIRIPTMEGEKVKIVLLESCSGILVDGVSKDFMGGENILTANGSSIILKNSSYKPKIKAILPVEDDPNLDNAHTVKLLGTFINSNDWSYTDVFTVASDSLSASLTLSLEEREYSFGVDVGGEWCANGATFTCSDNSSTGINPTTGNNMKLVASKAGEYTFTWIFATNTLTIVCPNSLLDISTCTEAAAAALTVSADNELYNGGKVYTITAKVSEIVTEWKDGSMTFWMAEKTDGGRVLEAYKCSIPKKENDVLIGDKVAVTGQLTKNKNTPMFSSGCTVEVIKRDTITCTTAAKKANNNKTEERVIKGYVTSITEAWTSAYKNVTFWMADTYNGGQVFQAYRVQCKNEEDAPEVGDHVWVRGKITKYGDSVHGVTIFRTASGGTFGVLATPVLSDPRNCAEAAEAALSVSANGELYKKGQKYTIKGYVTAIANEWSSNYSNISFWMADTKDGGQVLQAYRASCISEYYAPKIGDCVRVTGSLTKHGETPEFAAGCTFEIIDEYELQNCSEAAVAALSVSKDKELYNNGKEYRLVGFVTAIATEWNSNYKNISFWMADTYDGGEVLEAYRAVCKSKSDAPQVGDYVSVSGSLTKYGGTPEFAEGCTFSILSRGRAEEIVTSDITATLTEDGNAIFEWTSVDDADTYTIALSRDGRWIYTYIFNAEGQLINFYSQLTSYFTLARTDRERNVEMAEQTAKGWRFIVNGLITDATYSCSVTCKNKNNTVLFSKTIDFALPEALQSTNNVQTDADKLIKVIRDGQLLILREGKVYSVQGQEVK